MAKETKKRVTKKAPAKKKKAAVKKVVKPVKKAVAKKRIAKKAVAKKRIAKKAVAKKRIAKKAVAKKAVAKKSVAKKTVAKKAVAKKRIAKKATSKKAVAKKPLAKKAVAKKATSKKSAAKKPATSRTVAAAPINTWINKESSLPVFLQSQNQEIKKDLVVTQKYNQKTNNSVKYGLALFFVLFLGWGVNSYLLNSGNSSDANGKESTSISVETNGTGSETDSATGGSNMQGEGASSTTTTPKPRPMPSASASASGSSDNPGTIKASPSITNSNSTVAKQAPLTFTSEKSSDGAILKWLTPKNIGNLVAYELYGRVVGQPDWVLLSTVTTEQLSMEVDLTSSDSKTEFKVASLLDNEKQVFNKTIITLPGSLT